MPKYRIKLPEAPDEEYEIDAPEGADFDEIENEIRTRRAQEKAQAAAKQALDKAVQPVVTPGTPIGENTKLAKAASMLMGPGAMGARALGRNEEEQNAITEGIAGPVTGALGGSIAGIPGMVAGALGGALPSVFGQRTSPADAALNAVPSPSKPLSILDKIPGLRQSARPAVDETLKSLIPAATPYANAIKQRLGNMIRGAIPGAAEGAARGAANRTLSTGEAPSLETRDALVGGALGGVSGLASIDPIKKTAKQQGREFIEDLAEKDEALAKQQNLNIDESKLIKGKAKMIVGQLDAERRRQKALAGVKEEISGVEKQAAPIKQQLENIGNIRQAEETLSADVLKRRTVPLENKIKRAQTEIEGIDAILEGGVDRNKLASPSILEGIKDDKVFSKLNAAQNNLRPEDPKTYETLKNLLRENLSEAQYKKVFGEPKTQVDVGRLQQRRAKLLGDITTSKQQLDALAENPLSGKPATPLAPKLQQAQKKVAAIGPETEGKLSQQLAPAEEKLVKLRPIADMTEKEISELNSKIDLYTGGVKPSNLTKAVVDDYLATMPVKPGSTQTQSERLYEIMKDNSSYVKERMEIADKIKSAAQVFGPKRQSAVINVIADFVSKANQAVPTGMTRAALAGLGVALKEGDLDLAATLNKGLSHALGSKTAKSATQMMQTWINMMEEPRKPESPLPPSTEDEEEEAPLASSREALLQAIAQQEGYYNEDESTRARRNKNPGNLRGKDGFYMYPSDDEGWNALAGLLEKNQEKTLRAYIAQHAPKEDKNDPDTYVKNVIERLKKKGISVSEDTLLSELLTQ